ncbi:MAG TPA: TldD/PmbA family protein [Candidatus Brocadiia bacterium]|nr:TldD/PmbA family protein [Candidatus Brocadiia bacterium]
MREILEKCLEAARLCGAQFAEARFVDLTNESYEVRNGRPAQCLSSTSRGLGVRVIAGGAWGFSSTSRVEDAASAEKIAADAVKIARASAIVAGEPVRLAPNPPGRGAYKTPCEEDPLKVGVEEKLGMLADAELRLHSPELRVTQAFMTIVRKITSYANSEGRGFDQEITESGAGIAATAVRDSDFQVRSYPNSFRGNFATAGFEYVRGLDLAGNAERVAAEARQLLDAPVCPSGKRDVILDGGQLGLQVHESIGHPIELDRVLGSEADFAGTSFLTTEKLGNFQYGSEHVNVVADATEPGGLGTFGFDDEGTPARRVPIIEAGRFVGYISDRESAARLGLPSAGAARASSWNRIPIVRMTNINLLPGKWELGDLIADTDGGLFMATNRSWSIDDRRLNFQFGTEIAWEIEGGKLGRIYRNPTYTGITPEFWNSCDAVCSAKHWRMWGTPNCGKGQPGQTAHVGHGAAPARFRNVRIGVVR